MPTAKSAYLAELDEQIRQKKERQNLEWERERALDEKLDAELRQTNTFPWDGGRKCGGGDPFYDENGEVVTDLKTVVNGGRAVSLTGPPSRATTSSGRAGGGGGSNRRDVYSSASIRSRRGLPAYAGASARASNQAETLTILEEEASMHAHPRPPRGDGAKQSAPRARGRPSAPDNEGEEAPSRAYNGDSEGAQRGRGAEDYYYSPTEGAPSPQFVGNQHSERGWGGQRQQPQQQPPGRGQVQEASADIPAVISFVCGGEVATYKIGGSAMCKADYAALVEGYCAHHGLPFTRLM